MQIVSAAIRNICLNFICGLQYLSLANPAARPISAQVANSCRNPKDSHMTDAPKPNTPIHDQNKTVTPQPAVATKPEQTKPEPVTAPATK
jgi:hypothetical protein